MGITNKKHLLRGVFFLFIVSSLFSCRKYMDFAFTDPNPAKRETIVSKPDEPVTGTAARVPTKGIVRDFTTSEGCEFLIEVEMFGRKTLYQPELLDEKYKDEGLQVSFTYTRSRRPVTCLEAIPIILDSIE